MNSSSHQASAAGAGALPTAEGTIPGREPLKTMFVRDPDDLVALSRSSSGRLCDPDVRNKPHLGSAIVADHMDMRRLPPVHGTEEEGEAGFAMEGRHAQRRSARA